MGRMCIVSLRVFGLWRRAAELMRGSSSWPPSKPSNHERRAAFFYLPSPSSSSSSPSSHRSQETDFQCFPTTAVQHCVFLPALGMAAVVWCVCVCVRETRHLEGHDKVCEMKLRLQVKLDDHVLHTCSRQETGNTHFKFLADWFLHTH